MATDSGCFNPVMICGCWPTSGAAARTAASPSSSIFVDIEPSLSLILCDPDLSRRSVVVKASPHLHCRAMINIISRHTPVLILLLLGCSTGAKSLRELRVCADPNNLPFSNQRREGFENRIAELIGI